MAKSKKIPNADDLIKNYLLQGCTNGKQAAISAGYSPKTAEQSASRVLRSVKAQDAIKKYQQTELDGFVWDKQKKLQELEKIIKHCAKENAEDRMNNPTAAIAAIKTHNEMQGDNAPTQIDNTHTVKTFNQMYED